jgi:hypothetical protein
MNLFLLLKKPPYHSPPIKKSSFRIFYFIKNKFSDKSYFDVLKVGSKNFIDSNMILWQKNIK